MWTGYDACCRNINMGLQKHFIVILLWRRCGFMSPHRCCRWVCFTRTRPSLLATQSRNEFYSARGFTQLPLIYDQDYVGLWRWDISIFPETFPFLARQETLGFLEVFTFYLGHLKNSTGSFLNLKKLSPVSCRATNTSFEWAVIELKTHWFPSVTRSLISGMNTQILKMLFFSALGLCWQV